MDDPRLLLHRTADLAAEFLESLDTRPVFPRTSPEALRSALGGPLPEGPTDPLEVVEELAAAAGPGVVAIPSGRYFGFVIGGSVPASVAADWLTTVWDQNAGGYACGPSALVAEEVAGGWLRELLGLPPHASFALVTGCQMAGVTCLAAARHGVLRKAGWDVSRDGLYGAPRIRVLVGAKRHTTIDRALRLLGMGAPTAVAADGQGRMRPEGLRAALSGVEGPAIVCAQAGEVNTGSVDPLHEVADACAEAGAWMHVDGAFGLWAAVSPSLRGLVAGTERADSWATDAHKWLNVPYDCGLAFCRHPEDHRAAMATTAEYLTLEEDRREALDWTPEFSRRARGFPVYAAIRSLGRSGIAELVERCCAHARRFGEELADLARAEVLNDVVLNQVLVCFDSDERTDEVLRLVQESGEAWMSPTTWQDRRAIRISVCNWQTSDRDVDRTLAAFATAAHVSERRLGLPAT